ncbi:MAG: efflux RND transporter periplasmic adaptor subunit [Anaerolineae bacterium]
MKASVKIGGILIILILAGVGALFLLRGTESAADEPAASTAVVTRGGIEELVSASGNVVAERQATLAFASSGEIVDVLVEEGQQIEAGQVLARLDTTSLEWQIAIAQANLDTAQARLKQAQEPPNAEELASAQAALDSARANYEDVKDGPSAEELASAQVALDSTRANYEDIKDGPSAEELASAQAALDSARAALEQAQASYDLVKDRPDVQMLPEALSLENATIEMERAQADYDGLVDHPTDSEVASAEAQVASAEATLADLQERPTESEMASAEAQVASAEATLADLQERPKAEDVAVYQAQVQEAAVSLAQAEDQLDDALIVAPFGGAILEVQVDEGEWATPGAPAFVLAAIEPLVLDVDVDEVDIAQLVEGQTAYLSFDALKDREAVGIVSYIAPSSTNVGGAVAYRVEVSFAPRELLVRLGMTADVDIVVGSADDALLVPNRAIEADRQAGRYYVTRRKADGSTERLEVRIGLRDEAHAQVLEGVEEGDRLVLPEVPTQTQSEQGFGPGSGGGPFGGGGRP